MLICSSKTLILGRLSLGFIDDIIHLNARKDAKRELMDLGDHSLKWGKNHGAIFDSQKAQYMFLTHSKAAKSPLLFDGQSLQPLKEFKWLGMWFDENLMFRKQVAHVKKKADGTMGQLLKIGHSHWGVHEQERGLLISVFLAPRVLYRVQVWYSRQNEKMVTNALDLITNSEARFALGYLKSTPVMYLRRYIPFRPLDVIAKKQITTYFLTKIFRVTHSATSIERQIRV